MTMDLEQARAAVQRDAQGFVQWGQDAGAEDVDYGSRDAFDGAHRSCPRLAGFHAIQTMGDAPGVIDLPQGRAAARHAARAARSG